VDLPRDADMQFEFIKTGVGSVEELKAGDFLFFSSSEELKDVSHVGVYVGDGKFIQAAKSKGMVVETGLIRNITLKG